ncbi:unnamed protein product [Clavelina lepadiformis]|uniref:Uncharacterized protein n=1 Tax=Clavelina lepadiformis TaxID=159417 RepID=A0ABP0EZZ8_CLALP
MRDISDDKNNGFDKLLGRTNTAAKLQNREAQKVETYCFGGHAGERWALVGSLSWYTASLIDADDDVRMM